MAERKIAGAYPQKARIRRSYKDGLFRLIFSDKKGALELYNALNGSAYTDPDLLEITTIEDVIYMGFKNDLSFLVETENELDLYEAQSSWCPNMPLRGLIYFSNLYQGYIMRHGLDLYSSKLIALPRPAYMVFYNGTREREDQEILRLSEAFAAGSRRRREEEETLQVIVKVWNINYGHNKELMENCRRLHDYAYLVEQIRANQKRGQELAKAVNQAIADCIENNILREFLLKHRGEVQNVLLTEYDERLHIWNEKQISQEEGIRIGMERGVKQGIEQGTREGIRQGIEQGIEALILDNQEEGVSPERILRKLQKRFSLTETQAVNYMKKFSAEGSSL